MRVDIMLNERYYGTINVKCLVPNSPIIIEETEIREEIEIRLPLLKGKNFKIRF